MENQRLKFVQDFIGMQFTGSPSPYGHWLYGKVVSAVMDLEVSSIFVLASDRRNIRATDEVVRHNK